MNSLLIGIADKTDWLLKRASGSFLLIDDGPIVATFLEEFPKTKLFDIAKDSFNPLRGIDYKRARDFAEAIYTASPQGENTLTVRNGKRALLKLLLSGASRLTDLPSPEETKDDAEKEALGAIEDVLFSPVLKRVLCNPTNFSFKGQVVVKLDRAAIGDFDAFILASLLIGQYKGQVIVPDLGFYGRNFYMSLIRQERLIAAVQTLSQLPVTLKDNVLLIKDKQGEQCTYDDAQTLALYAGLIPGTVQHTEFVQQAVS